MPPEPAVGSATLARLDSSSSSNCVLRAMRRAKRSGNPIAAVNGSTVIASAPPMPAENAAMVVRSMFTYGSRRVIIRHAVSAETKAGAGAEPAGLFDARPEFPKRAKLGDGQELIGVGGEAEFDHAARRIERDAAPSSARRYATATAST